MYLIDTNILIYHIDGNAQAVNFIAQHNNVAISIISIIEILSYPYAPNEKAIVINFLQQFRWLYIDDSVAFLAANNRRHKKTKTPDAIIGATAQHHHLTLVTNNIKDFIHLPIHLINPLT